MKRLFNWIKSNPYIVAGVVGFIALVFFFSRGSSKQVATSSNGTSDAVKAINAQTAAAANISAIEASTAANVAKIQATAAQEIQANETKALESINATNQSANTQNLQIVTETSRLGKLGVHGIVSIDSDHPVEQAGRALGYNGYFGDGGLDAWLVGRLGSVNARDEWYRDNGADWL